MNNKFDEIAKNIPIFSSELSSVPTYYKEKATDIKFQIASPPIILMGKDRHILNNCKILSKFDMQELIFSMCENSIYKHTEEIKKGFISVKNCFRAGICGTAIIKNNEIENISDISSIVIRVPRFISGCAEDLIKKVPSFLSGVLIVGEPSSGKTTVLRDLISFLSKNRLVVLDERWELTGRFPINDVDVLYAYPKFCGINQALRNLGATHIICDEIETDDFDAIENASACGVSIIATIHGNLSKGIRPIVKKLLVENTFSYIVELKGRENPCMVRKVWTRNELLKSYRSCDDMLSVNSTRNTQNNEFKI